MVSKMWRAISMMIHFIICQLKQFFCDKKEGGAPPYAPYPVCYVSEFIKRCFVLWLLHVGPILYSVNLIVKRLGVDILVSPIFLTIESITVNILLLIFNLHVILGLHGSCISWSHGRPKKWDILIFSRTVGNTGIS